MLPQIPLERFEVFAEGLDHPEGLAFDRDGDLWAGGEQGQIYRISRKGEVRTVTTLGGFNLGLTFSAQQELFVCNFKLGALLQLSRSGKVKRTWERAGRYRLRNPNFAVFDSEGNLYFSDSGTSKRPTASSSFFVPMARSSNCLLRWRFRTDSRSAPTNARSTWSRAPGTMS